MCWLRGHSGYSYSPSVSGARTAHLLTLQMQLSAWTSASCWYKWQQSYMEVILGPGRFFAPHSSPGIQEGLEQTVPAC